MSESLSFEFVLDPSETVRAGHAIEERAGGRSWRIWLFWLMIPLAGAIGFRAPARALVGLLLISALILLINLVLPLLRRRQIRRFYAGTPALAGAQRYQFSDQGLTLSNASASNTLRWSAFVEAAETPEFFLLYYSKRCAYYLPRRVMGPEVQVDAMRRLLRDQLGERATAVAPPT
jgi:hypothetical protein